MLVRSAALALIAAIAVPALLPPPAAAEERLVTIERFVPHTSTVPANEGQRVGLYLREKASAEAMARFEAGAAPEGRVVLFVHGGSVSSVPDYDLDYQDYSWMGHLAEAGFDTFAMDHTGYGRSPRPKMDDACNMSEADQAIVTPHPLAAPCEPSYPFGSTTVQSDWDEIDTVVDYIRELRGVERVSLVGWSAGGRRTGGYAARHPEKVDKLFLFAPGYSPDGPSEAPGKLPAPGVPMRLQTRDTLMHGRWEDNVACENQVDPGGPRGHLAEHPVIRPAGLGLGPARGGHAGPGRQLVVGLESRVRREGQRAHDDRGRRAGQPRRPRRAARRPDGDRLPGPRDHGVRHPLRELGDRAVPVHAPGDARVAVRGDLPGAPQRRLPGGRRRVRSDGRVTA